MSIFGALQASVSGLNGQGQRLGTISDNIANATTTGYKRSDIEFATLVVNNSSSQFSPGGVRTFVQNDISIQGTAVASTSNTDLAIAGAGFFVVTEAPDPDPTDGLVPVGAGSFSFTRAGTFGPDEDGFLRNAQGFYLQAVPLDPTGQPLDPATGAVQNPSTDTFNSLQAVNVNNFNFVGQPSTTVEWFGNYDTDELTDTSGTLLPSVFTTTYVNAVGQTDTIEIEFDGENDGDNVLNVVIRELGSIGGTAQVGSFEIVFALSGPDAGTPFLYQNPVVGGTGSYLDAIALVSNANGDQIGVAITFDDRNGVAQTITLNFGEIGTRNGIVTSAADSEVRGSTDGAAASALAGVDIDERGRLFAIFENGARIPQFDIFLADFINPDGLQPLSGTRFQQSADSGNFLLGVAGSTGLGQIAAGALETSNADIAEELTSLIVTQRAYSANATVIRTADDLLEELVRLR